ncbi:hypothetical protein BAOM_3081 [Peribacillus asahii]|uniref:Defence against restriction A C-terminal domain-containing protein n=1 Tax=Peribacillus asahii TaxID=228899 RepID=A0A3T0KTS4_9BACI|nr:hypothetical protein [Peribacillus asahii]AZV43690.1 hypothetical protein BAOM_3081 [Peribacillus asahii]
MTNLIYTVEVKDWNNDDTYPTLYEGSSLIIAMMHFKEAHLNNEDVVLFITDQEGNELDVITNYNNENNNVIHCNDFFVPTDKELKKEHNEVVKQKEVYVNLYQEELTKNETIKKDNERLYNQVRKQSQEINKLNNTIKSLKVVNENDTTKQQTNNNLFWYAYRLRGFSPFCQPKGHIKVDQTIGRYGIIAYARPLTDNELEEYDLVPYNEAVTA